MKLAVKLDFRVSNNEAEYEAVLVGLRAAREAEDEIVVIFSDSLLATQQVKESYETKNEKKLIEYVKAIQELSEHFVEWSIVQVPRSENTEAYALAKMATSLTVLSDREVIYQVEVIPAHQTSPASPEQPGWMTPILQYVRDRKLPENKTQDIQIKKRALRFVVIEGILYKRSFFQPLLRSLGRKRWIISEKISMKVVVVITWWQ